MKQLLKKGVVLLVTVALGGTVLAGCGNNSNPSKSQYDSMPQKSRTSLATTNEINNKDYTPSKNNSKSVNGKAGSKFSGAPASTGIEKAKYNKSNNQLTIVLSKKMSNASYSSKPSARIYSKKVNNRMNKQIQQIRNKTHNKKLNIVTKMA